MSLLLDDEGGVVAWKIMLLLLIFIVVVAGNDLEDDDDVTMMDVGLGFCIPAESTEYLTAALWLSFPFVDFIVIVFFFLLSSITFVD